MNARTVIGLLLGLWMTISQAGAEEATINMFGPQGEVKVVRQVTARFKEQMVPFGDPRLVEPFDITCAEKGRARWADSRNWVYDFERDLPAGVICEFTVKPDLKTLAGKKISGQQKFSFTTGGPAIKRSNPYEGGQIDEKQVFILALDAEAKEDTVLAHASCVVEGITEQIGIRIIKGKDRDDLLKTQGQYFRYGLSRDGAGKIPLLVLQCKQRFPTNAKMQLLWGKGIQSLSSVPTSTDQTLTYRVREPFKATFSCNRENEKADCIPILPFDLYFSSSVAREYAEKIVMKGPNNTVFKPMRSRSEEEGEDPSKKPAFVNHVVFPAPLPALTFFSIELPKDIKDDAGRPLSNADKFPLTVKTADYPPLAKFASRFGIIERADPVLPVTLRNIEAEVKARMFDAVDAKNVAEKAAEGVPGAIKDLLSGQVSGKVRRFATEADITVWLDRVSEADPRKSVFSGTQEEKAAHDFIVPKPNGPKAFEVVGIPLKEAGFYVVELESKILGESLHGESRPYYVPAAALVTNLAAHFKQGRESSLVWVTTLDKAEPVKDAAVSIRGCEGKVYWEGKTDASGLAAVNKELPEESKLPRCRDYDMRGYYVFARTADDMTFVRSGWSEGIETWRFNLPQGDYRGPVIAHTILDRSLLRAGETVSMKHLIRKHTTTGFSQIKHLPNSVVIQHQGSDQRYEFPLTWDQSGIAETTWKIPKDAKLGTYTITLLKKGNEKIVGGFVQGYFIEDGEYFNPNGWQSGSFRVEEFRVPLMKGIIQPPRDPLVNSREAIVDFS